MERASGNYAFVRRVFEMKRMSVNSKLSQHAKTATQNVYQAYTKDMQTKLSFLTRTTPDMEEYLQEPEKLITENLILSLTGKKH